MTTKILGRKIYWEARFSFHFIFYQEDDAWIGHCLETDTVAEGRTPPDAVRNLKTAITMQIDDALAKKDASIVFNPAPREYWRLLPQAIPMTHVREYADLRDLLKQLGKKVRTIIHKG